ncbi:MAG: tetratricopeptide repeat protein [Treponema sp.]|nr:tetratricopeptide repeat protein [Treponema sp.]
MNSHNPLESVYFINIPDNFPLSSSAMHIDKTIPLPVQRKSSDAPGNFNMEDLTAEQILSGILLTLAYDHHNEHLDYYRSIIKQARPNIITELSNAAILKAKNEDWELAEELFMTLRGIEPENYAIILNTALFLDQRAESYRRSGLHDDADAYDNDALMYYKDAMNAEPPISDAFFNAGFFYLKQRNFREAKGCFETYIALTCDITDEELGENGIYKKERAQEIINNIANDNMDDERFSNAVRLISSGQEEKGLAEIRKFLETNPKVWNAWFLLGWGMRRTNRYEQAMQAFSKAIECGADTNAETYNELAICQMEMGNLDEAKKSLLKAFSLSPEDTKIISNLGFLFEKIGNNEEARKYFTTVLEFNPNDKIAIAELARLENIQ